MNFISYGHDIDCDDDEECECGVEDSNVICPGCESKCSLYYGPIAIKGVIKITVSCAKCGWITDAELSPCVVLAG